MPIDWFTVGAQVLNFIILVGLMRRFLYKPILHAIDQREQRIAGALADADAKAAEAKRARDEFEGKNTAFDEQRAELLRAATEAAEAERQRLLDAARTAAAALQDQRMEALRRDASRLNQAIVRRAQEEVFAIARKALAELAATTLEQQMAEVFTRRLAALEGEARVRLAQALNTGATPAVVRSAFELPAAQREAIQRALSALSSAEVELSFETAPALVSGIELTASGQKIAWSISEYLGALEKRVGELLNGQAAAPPAVPAARVAQPGPAPAAGGR